jgi:hypothetical protein
MSAPLPPAARPGVRLIVMAGDGMSSVEGVILDGAKEEDGDWDLDGRFVLLTADGERIRVNEWACLIEMDEDQGEEGQG